MKVRGDMVDAEGPMGPEQKTWGGWWSVLLTLGSEHPRVRVSYLVFDLNLPHRSFLLGLIWTTTSTMPNSTTSDSLHKHVQIQS